MDASPRPTSLKMSSATNQQALVYMRILGKKPGPGELQTATGNSSKFCNKGDSGTPPPPSAADPGKSRQGSGGGIFNFFSKESKEERQIRSCLKQYRQALQSEQIQLGKALVRHRKRVAEQSREFETHEMKLSVWGLKFILPFYRMQAWSRLSRSVLLRDLAQQLERDVAERMDKTVVFLKHFEESSNRLQKYSLEGAQEFCIVSSE